MIGRNRGRLREKKRVGRIILNVVIVAIIFTTKILRVQHKIPRSRIKKHISRSQTNSKFQAKLKARTEFKSLRKNSKSQRMVKVSEKVRKSHKNSESQKNSMSQQKFKAPDKFSRHAISPKQILSLRQMCITFSKGEENETNG